MSNEVKNDVVADEVKVVDGQNESQNETETEADGKGGHVRVTMEQFIETWENVVASDNPSVQAVADALGLKKESVAQRATQYRTQRGVPLSNMPRGGAKFKTQAAIELVAKLKAEREARLNKAQ